MNPLVSICVAAAKYNRYEEYYERFLRSLFTQTFRDWELVVSDHDNGETSGITSALTFKVISEFNNFTNQVFTYIPFGEKQGFAAANLNNAIKHAKGRYIKPMFTDDYFADRDALFDMVNAIRDKKWLGVGCQHCDDNGNDLAYYHSPGFDPSMVGCRGYNLIGSPSVVMFAREDCELFDENLRHYNDCELYYRMGKKFGLPALLDKPLVYIRLSNDSVTGRTTDADKLAEQRYLDQKHGVGF